MHLELRVSFRFETFDDDEVDGREVRHELGQRRLALVAELVHESPAPRARDEHLARARETMRVRVLAGLIDVEVVMRVLQRRDRTTARDQHREDLGEQRGLAAAAPPREADHSHHQRVTAGAVW